MLWGNFSRGQLLHIGFVLQKFFAVVTSILSVKIEVVQQLAGHDDISTTRKYYLVVKPEDLAYANSFFNKVLAEIPTNRHH